MKNKRDATKRINRLRSNIGRRVGWFVTFTQPNDLGEIPHGFFIDDDRAKTFSKEPGFLRHRIDPVYLVKKT